jgi:hypothetical protein
VTHNAVVQLPFGAVPKSRLQSRHRFLEGFCKPIVLNHQYDLTKVVWSKVKEEER